MEEGNTDRTAGTNVTGNVFYTFGPIAAGSGLLGYVPNRKVACTPFESLAIETQGTAFKTVKQKTTLYRLKVLIGNERFSVGSFVFVRGDVVTLPWTKEVFEQGGDRFILVPEDFIQLVRYQEG